MRPIINIIFVLLICLGPTATAELRKKGCICPVIGITGNVLPADLKVFMDSGAVAVLPKPLQLPDLESLFDTIRE
jgi:CheY-like chemotaxis protein